MHQFPAKVEGRKQHENASSRLHKAPFPDRPQSWHRQSRSGLKAEPLLQLYIRRLTSAPQPPDRAVAASPVRNEGKHSMEDQGGKEEVSKRHMEPRGERHLLPMQEGNDGRRKQAEQPRCTPEGGRAVGGNANAEAEQKCREGTQHHRAP